MNIDPSVTIWDNCIIGDDVEIGENSVIGACTHILGKVKIGKDVRIQSFCFIPSGTEIQDNVFIGPRCTILNDKNPPSKGKEWKPVLIERGAVIGGNVTILPGVTIGAGAMVGAGTLVIKDVKSSATIYNEIKRVEK